MIEYDANNQMVIVEEGTPVVESNSSVKPLKSNLTPDEQKALDEENQLVNEIKAEAANYPVYKIENPAPQPGLRVEYDGEGYIKQFLIQDDGVFVPFKYKALPRGTRKPAGTYTYGHGNTIIISESKVQGEGRITNYTDEQGEKEESQRGDAATRGDIDNPDFNTVLRVRNLDNDKTGTVRKRDDGSLPDAVLDLWKKTVKDFGVEWSNSVSFSGRYYYSF
ncbi:septal ring lytic transglycosylase RlpA family protein [Paenibacillus macerans]|uniref:septal ring lytic transglycosylase RlpA family protein n=1 Tax=Paenibacillus macerans TaxID=44252 RepID=UPI0020416A97|nr:septal ring lytic transglycosylase RlpA family protein [Paenibacillus macerans]MCM3698928.1 septal ring lytic transglycosylase RlpA family protein [Paenibacillus macerans]